jgi:hypothetical protein
MGGYNRDMPRDRPPGIWKSLKRALGGAEPRPDPPPPRELPERPQVTPDADAVLSAPPFLLPDPEGSDDPVVASVLPAREEPPTVPASASEPADASGRPRLARGLASFSRSNADREKKFAHLLHDDTSGEKPPGTRD